MSDSAVVPQASLFLRTVSLGRRHGVSLLLILILVAAAIPRFTNVNWDKSNYLQPDERFVVMVTTAIDWPHSVSDYFDSAHSPLNPYNHGFNSYIYGDVVIFLGKLAGNVAGKNDYGNVHIPGRELAATFDLITVLLVFLTGRRLFGAAAGLLGAALLAFTTLDIQLAHFYAADSFVTTFCLAAFYFVLRTCERNRLRDIAIAGFMAGAAVATKLSALPVIVMLAVPFVEQLRRGGWGASIRVPKAGLPPVIGLGSALFISLCTFRILQPYAFLGPSPFSLKLDPRWRADVHSWNRVQNGIADIPPSIQWAGRTPILFMARNMVYWGMGPLLGGAALIALVVGGFRLISGRRWPSAIYAVLVGWPAFHIVYYGARLMKTMRYWLPAYPFLVLLAAGLLIEIARRGRSFGAIRFRLGWLPAGFVLLGTLFSGLAFTSIYHRPITRIAASEWIYDNIPAGSTVTSESWDDALPYWLPNEPPANQYAIEELDLYGEESPLKVSRLMTSLMKTDYVFETSSRLYGSIPRIPERYPMTSEYYRMLFSGDLGFDLVQTFTSHPSLFGISLNDDGAEEAFTVYDHPKVMIFKKSAHFSAAAVERKLAFAFATGGDIVNVRPAQAGKHLLQMDDAERTVQQVGGTWSAIFDRTDLVNRHPVRVWWLALQVMALAGVGLSWRVFRGLPDRGYAISKTLGILVAGYVAWLLPSLHLMDFGRPAVVIGIGATAALSIVAIGGSWRQFAADLTKRWPQIVATELMFTVAFFVFVWFRSKNPDLWHPYRGGEKPMEFAYFNAVIKSTHFPPYDPWFAGGYINYYYYGYALFASITRLTGVIPAVAFNLAVPTCFALLVLNSWSFVSNALQVLLRPRRTVAPLALGLLGPLFVAVLGNLDLPRAIGQGQWDYPDVASRPFGAASDIARGVYRAIFARRPVPTDAYWGASRVIDGTINEFPYWTMLFADFHPHLIALPFTSGALVMALGIAMAKRWPERASEMSDVTAPPDAGLFQRAGDWRARVGAMPKIAVWDRLLLTGVAALVTGTLFPLNTWDFPTYVAITLAVFFLLELLPERGDGDAPRRWDLSFDAIRRAALWSVATVAGGRLLFWPYFTHYETPSSGFDRWTQEATRPGQYLIVHGVLLFFVVSYLLIEIGSKEGLRWGAPLIRPLRSKRRRVDGPIDGQRSLFIQFDYVKTDAGARAISIAAVFFGLATFYAMAVGEITPLLTGLIVLSALAAWRRRREPLRLLLIAMTGIAFCLSLAVERYALHGDIGRMNTVFKFYLQIWMLLGLVAAIGAAMVVLRGRHHVGFIGKVCWSVAGAFLITAALIFPAIATPARLDDRFNPLPRTLDGMAYMQSATYDDNPHDNEDIVSYSLDGDYRAITWLQDNIAGSPVVLEGNTPLYRWGSRVSVYTGLPDVIGWDWHQTQQRMAYGQLIDSRKADVQSMLEDNVPFEKIAPLLDKYHVQLIYIGALERAYYDADGLQKFADAAAAGQLTVIYDASGVAIYRYAGGT